MRRVVVLLLLVVAVSAQQPVKYCLPFDPSPSVLSKCNSVMEQVSGQLQISCVGAASPKACMRKIHDSEADITTLAGADIFEGWMEYGLRPIVSEDDGNGLGTKAFAVAVASKGLCSNETWSLQNLKGARMCSAGYGTPAGWVNPIGYLLDQEVMELASNNPSIRDDAESAVGFFGDICAPSEDSELVSQSDESTKYEPLCTGCPDNCYANSMYSSPLGALKCLFDENDGMSVAFTTMAGVREAIYEREDILSTEETMQEYRFFCPWGACTKITDESIDTTACHWGRLPSPVIVGPPSYVPGTMEGLIADALQNSFREMDWDWFEEAKSVGAGDRKNVIVSSEADALEPIVVDDLQEYVDSMTFQSFQTINELSKPARFCVINDEELEACRRLVASLQEFDTGNPGFVWRCVDYPSSEDCFKAIAQGSAEMRLADPAQMYFAREKYSLSPLVNEYYAPHNENMDPDNYAVVVVDKELCDKNGSPDGITTLRGRSGCFTGYGRDEWWMLLGKLVSMGDIQQHRGKNDMFADALALDKYFDKLCAPGSLSDGAYYAPLCELCKDNCTADDGYHGHVGALECLAETEAGFAVTSQWAAREWTMEDGKLRQRRPDEESSFKLLCPWGNCADVDSYEGCSLAAVKANAIVTPHEMFHKTQLQDFLVQVANDPDQGPKIFKSGFFSGPTQALQPVTTTMSEYLGEQFFVYQDLNKQGWTGDGQDIQRGNGDILYCIPLDIDEYLLKECNKMFSKADDLDNDITFRCIIGGSTLGCMQMVANGTADMVMLDAQDQYYAIQAYGLAPIATEETGTRWGDGYAVAVVKTEFCESKQNASFADLEGKQACSTGYGKYAGWMLPMGFLHNQNLFGEEFLPYTEKPTIRTDAQAAVDFFSTICAPGVSYLGPVIYKNGTTAHWDKLCDKCPEMDTGNCRGWDFRQESYDSYGERLKSHEQAMRCFTTGKRDVAFTHHYAALVYNKDAEEEPEDWVKFSKDELRLLCPTGGCKPINEYESCNLGYIPSNAIMVREYTPAVAQLVYQSTQDAQWFLDFGDFNGIRGFPWGYEASRLNVVTDVTRSWGHTALSNLKGRYELNKPQVKWCVEHMGQYQYCLDNVDAMNANQNHTHFSCYYSESTTCAYAISEGMADMALMDPYDVFSAQQDFNLTAIALELSTMEEEELYSVAVVRKEACDQGGFSLFSIKGKNMCSSGYRRTAGWIIPVGYMLYKGDMFYISVRDDIQDDAETVDAYFEKVCAPRVTQDGPKLNTSEGQGIEYVELCTACNGEGTNCTEYNPYYDNDGALHCLMDGAGDVAFLTHTTPLARAKDGSAPLEWSNLNMTDMKLVCPGKRGCAALDDYEDCSFGKLPPRAIVSRWDFPDVRRVRRALANITESAAFFGQLNNETATDPSDMLFSVHTWGFSEITSTDDYLGKVVDAYQGFRYLNPSSTYNGKKK